MKTRVLFTSLIICLCGSLTFAQPGFDWAKSLGGGSGSADIGYAVAVDQEGNVITSGEFWGTGDFDPGPGTYNLVSAGNHDIFVCKLDSSGNFVWAKRIGGTSADYGYANTIDESGNIYVTGVFSLTVDFDPGPGTYNLTATGGWDIFVLKLNPSGDFVWADRMGGSSTDIGYSVAIDTMGNVFTAGWFNFTADFDPGAGTYNLTSAGGEDAFICKLDSSGNFVWANKLGGTTNDRARSVVIDPGGNPHTAGVFTGTADFDPGAATYNLVSHGVDDVFISKLDSAGNFLWAAGIGGPLTEWTFGVALDGLGNVYTSGNFSDTADFDPGICTYELISAGNEDVFVSKLNAQGNFVWAEKIGGTASDMSRTIEVDYRAGVHITGYFSGTIDFDPGSGVFNLSASGGALFVSTLDTSGSFVCAGMFEASYCHATAADKFGHLYLTGDYSGTHDFDPGAGIFNLTSVSGTTDVYMVKLDACFSCATTFSNTLLSVCDSFVSPSGNYNWTVTGIYTDTIPNTLGCDSIMTFDLTVVVVDTSVTDGGNVLTSNASGATYQWLDCNNSYAIVPSETGISFSPSITGSYAVQVIYNGCTDTSSCHAVTITGVSNNNTSGLGIEISPNPAFDYITIRGMEKMRSFSVYNMFGQIVCNFINSKRDAMAVINVSDFRAGIYVVIFDDGINSFTRKLIVRKGS